MKLPRGRAARVLDDIRVWLAAGDTATTIEAKLLDQYGVPPLVACEGEAHRAPAHHDNCLTCAPRWGFTGEFVSIT